MQISPISAYNNPYQFCGLFGRKKSQKKNNPKEYVAYRNAMLEGQVTHAGQLFNRHGTLYFRHDLNWQKLGKYLKDKFSDSKNVQTLIWGCSEGQEAYSLAILLKHYFGDDYKKFLPIKAMDIDSKIIEQNNKYKQSGFSFNGPLVIEPMKNALDIPSLKFDTSQMSKYFKQTAISQYRFKDDILNAVDFSYSNIISDLDKIDSDNPSIVMCRNMWPYINSSKYDDYAKKLYDKLAPGSVVIIGAYDWEGERCIKNSAAFPKTLLDNGFKPIYGLENDKLIKNYKFPEIPIVLVFEK